MQFKDLKEVKRGGKVGGLGRGMEALIPLKVENGVTVSTLTSLHAIAADSAHIYQIAIEKISPFAGQPRRHFDQNALEELAASIKKDGLIQPIIVRKKGEGYELIAGERRWRAAALAELKTVPAIIKDLADKEALAMALVENIQRLDLTPLEEARAYEKLIKEHSLTQEQVAQMVGKDRSTIANTLRLLQLPSEIQPMVDEGQISAGHARAILTLSSAKNQKELAKRTVNEHLSVRQVERLAKLTKSRPKELKENASAINSAATDSAAISSRDLLERLQRALGCKVGLNDHKGHGTLELHYNSYSELDAITQKIFSRK